MYSTALNEAILDAWLQLTAIVNNDRLVSDLTLNESLVIRLLNQADQPLSASELCQRMTMKKSQMNRTLTAMEDKGLILRKRTSHDKRRMDILLTSKGQQLVEYQHRKILRLIDALVRRLGEQQASEVRKLFLSIAAMASEELSFSHHSEVLL